MIPQHTIRVSIEHQLIGQHSLQLTAKDSIAQLRSHLTESTVFLLYQNFHFQHNNKQVSEYSQIGDKCQLKVVFQPFDPHSSRHHYSKVKAILASPRQWAVIQNNVSTKDYTAHNLTPQSIFCDDNPLLEAEYTCDSRMKDYLHSSHFNPPPYYRMGDFFYIAIKFEEEVHVTANPLGYYVNLSQGGHFNPNPNTKYKLHTSLLELMFQLSTKFKADFHHHINSIYVGEFQKIFGQGRSSRKIWRRSVNSCIINKLKNNTHLWENIKIDVKEKKNQFSSLKDWNEIFQLQKIKQKDNIYQKINKEKLKQKISSQFMESAKEGIKKIIDGEISPLQYHPNFQLQTYFYSSLFFSYVSDEEQSTTLYTQTQINSELLYQSQYQFSQVQSFSISHKALVFYRGYHMVAQTLPPSPLYQQCFKGKRTMKQNISAYQISTNPIFAQPLLLLSKILSMPPTHLTTLSAIQCTTPPTIYFLTLSPCLRDPNLATRTFFRPQLLKLHPTALAHYAKETAVPRCLQSLQGPLRRHLADSESVIQVLHQNGLPQQYLSMIYARATQQHTRTFLQRAIFVRSAVLVGRRAMRARDCKERSCKGALVELLRHISCRNQEVEAEIKAIMRQKYSYAGDVADILALKYSKEAVLRDVCLSLGVVVRGEGIDEVEIQPLCVYVQREPKELEHLIEEGDKLVQKCHVEEAIEVYNKAVQLILNYYNGANKTLGYINKRFSQIYYKIGDVDTAVMFAEQSCQIFQAIYSQEHIETIDCYSLLGLYLFAQRQFNKAEKFLLKAITLGSRCYSEAYPQILPTLFNLSTVYETQSKYTDAILCLFYALETCIKVFGDNHLNTATCLAALASLHYDIPDIAQAIKYQGKCLKVLQNVLEPNHAKITETKAVLDNYKNLQNSKKIKQMHDKQQRMNATMQMYAGASMMRNSQLDSRNRFDHFWRQKIKKTKYFV